MWGLLSRLRPKQLIVDNSALLLNQAHFRTDMAISVLCGVCVCV